MRYIKIFFALLAIFYGLVVTVGCVSQKAFVWPMSAEEAVDQPVPPEARLVWVETEKGEKVEGWFFPGSDLSLNNNGPALIFFHGNNEIIDHCLEFAEVYPPWGISVLLVEYRGYGRSGGEPSREGIRSDMMKFYDWLTRQPEVDPEHIIFQGRSLGGAVAADFSTFRKPRAMILVSTFTSMEVMF